MTELAKEPATPEKTARTPIPAVKTTPDNRLHDGLKKTLQQAAAAQIQLSGFEAKFLQDMQTKYNLNGTFSWLTARQRATLEKILSKFGYL